MEKEKKIWARRWMADETAFSSVKRMFGEYMYHSNQVHNMVKKMVMKASLYNLFSRGGV